MQMYDKVKIWIDASKVRDEPIEKHLFNPKQETDLATGEVRTYGALGGLMVRQYVGGVSIVGSLGGYFYDDNNIYPLDKHTTKDAIQKLSDAIHIDLTDAKVTGFEFGNAFILKHPIKNYLQLLGNMPKMQRVSVQASTLYYKHKGQSQPNTYAFYDKLAEMRKTKKDIPQGFDMFNVLKYEMRYDGRLPQQLGVPCVTCSTLYERMFYKMLVKRYQDAFYSITKNVVLMDDLGGINSVNDGYNYLVSLLLNQADQGFISGYIDRLKDAKVFADSKYYTRLKNKIHDVATKATKSTTNDLIKELNDEIKNVGAFV